MEAEVRLRLLRLFDESVMAFVIGCWCKGLGITSGTV